MSDRKSIKQNARKNARKIQNARQIDLDCRNIRQRECRIGRQSICPKACQIECQNICQKECPLKWHTVLYMVCQETMSEQRESGCGSLKERVFQQYFSRVYSRVRQIYSTISRINGLCKPRKTTGAHLVVIQDILSHFDVSQVVPICAHACMKAWKHWDHLPRGRLKVTAC